MRNIFKPITIAIAAVTIVSFMPPIDKGKKKRKFIDTANMNPEVKPGDNFFRYANGTWLKNNPVPASKTRWGSFDALREESSKRLKTLLDEAAANTGAGKSTQQIGDFYSSGMDSVTLEQLGYQPIKANLDRIAAVKDINGLLNEMVELRLNAVGGTWLGHCSYT